MPTTDPELRRARSRARYRADPEKHKAYVAAWQKRNPEKVAAYQRKHRYNLPLGAYEEMLAAQDGRCRICGEADKRLVVDHNHAHCSGRRSCGRCVRGLLCMQCNAALSRVENDSWLSAAQNYLADFPLPD